MAHFCYFQRVKKIEVTAYNFVKAKKVSCSNVLGDHANTILGTKYAHKWRLFLKTYNFCSLKNYIGAHLVRTKGTI
jgi:hypothetical protein